MNNNNLSKQKQNKNKTKKTTKNLDSFTDLIDDPLFKRYKIKEAYFMELLIFKKMS